MAFLIRDDDVSFFTDRTMLIELYKFAWKKSFVVSFSVVPSILSSIKVGSTDNQQPDPCIPPSARNTSRKYEIRNNPKLVSFLLSMRNMRLCDMNLHGLSHDRFELTSRKENELRKVLDESLDGFSSAFHFSPSMFIFPYERSSNLSRKIVASKGLSFYRRMAPIFSVTNRILTRLGIRRPSFRPYNGVFEFFVPCPKASLAFSPSEFSRFGFIDIWDAIKFAKREFVTRYKHRDIFVIMHHYWEFYSDWEKHITQRKILNALNTFLDFVDHFNIWKCSFNELCSWLLEFNSLTFRRINKNRMILINRFPLKTLSFRSTGKCESKGLPSEPVETQDYVWTIRDIPANSKFEVICKD